MTVLLEGNEQGHLEIHCTLHPIQEGKGKMQKYPLQMMDIPHQPFYKITIDLVTDLNTSISGNQNILTIIDHLTGWPEVFPISDKKADTVVNIFINNYLPAHMCPRFILSNNGM